MYKISYFLMQKLISHDNTYEGYDTAKLKQILIR